MVFTPDFWGSEMGGAPGPAGPAGPEGPQGPAGGFTTDCGVFRDKGISSATLSFADKISQSPVVEGGTYFIFWTAAYTGTNNNTETELRIEVDGDEVDLYSPGAVSASLTDPSWSSFDLISLDAGVRNFKLQFRQPAGAGLLSVNNAKLGYILVKPADAGGGGGGGGGGPA